MPSQFCDACIAESTDGSAGNFKEGWFGKEFMGDARRCEKCFSTVRVLWRVFCLFPVHVVGCYRYRMTDMDFSSGQMTTNFISRRVPDDRELIRKTRIKGIVVAALILAAAATLILLFGQK